MKIVIKNRPRAGKWVVFAAALAVVALAYLVACGALPPEGDGLPHNFSDAAWEAAFGDEVANAATAANIAAAQVADEAERNARQRQESEAASAANEPGVKSPGVPPVGTTGP